MEGAALLRRPLRQAPQRAGAAVHPTRPRHGCCPTGSSGSGPCAPQRHPIHQRVVTHSAPHLLERRVAEHARRASSAPCRAAPWSCRRGSELPRRRGRSAHPVEQGAGPSRPGRPPAATCGEKGPVGQRTVEPPSAEIGRLKPVSEQVVVVMGASSGVGGRRPCRWRDEARASSLPPVTAGRWALSPTRRAGRWRCDSRHRRHLAAERRGTRGRRRR